MENLKIFIIEDDPTTCTLLKTTLEMDGYQVSFVHSIKDDDIVALLDEQQPDILFLDFHLGPKNTLDCVPVIRNNPGWQNLPVLMTSAIDRGQECLAAGADQFILKPFNWDEITGTIGQIRQQILNGEEA